MWRATQVLLDLLGHKHAKVTWHFRDTRPVFRRLQEVERRLRGRGLLTGNDGAEYLSDGHKLQRRGSIQVSVCGVLGV